MLNPTVSVPVVIDDALRAEAERTGLRRCEILEDWFVQTWPDYVARNLRRDLTSKGVIDVTAGHATPASAIGGHEEAIRPCNAHNDAPELEVRGADDLVSTPLVELDSTARHETEGSTGASA